METYCPPITKPVRTTEPTLQQEPVTLDEAKHQCGIAEGTSYYDADLWRFIASARQQVENDTGIVCYTGTFTWKLSQWPYQPWLEIRAVRPVTSVSGITYIDNAGVTQTWSSSEYSLDTNTVVPTIRLGYAGSWPITFRGDVNGITITMLAGYTSQFAIPPLVKSAVLLLVHHWHVTGEEGTVSPGIRKAYESIINTLARRTYP